MSPYILTPLLSLILLWVINRIFFKPRLKLPPSPPKLPVIGNLHQLSSLPHRDLHSLARKHGPIMLLRLGSVPALVISSADLAREITKTHDLVFSDRPVYRSLKKLLYDCKGVSTAPYGEYWRKMKSIFVVEMLSGKRVQSFRWIREEETALFMNKIEGCSGGPVNLSEMFAEMNDAEILRSSFGGETGDGKRVAAVMKDFTDLLGEFNVGDFIPWLGWTSRFTGLDKRLDKTAEEMDRVFESLIREREELKAKGEHRFVVDVLLEIYNDTTAGASIDRDSMKALLLDVFVGGSDTISTALEWAMSELLRHPSVMEKLQNEVRGIVKGKRDIEEEDLKEMPYLKAVIKEALRFHPPFPLLPTRVATRDVNVKGFDVSAGTLVMINAWAIGRDPVSWDEPDKFKPERFLNSSIDFKGHHYEFIPFGAGRRGCPGIAFGVAGVEFVLANLVSKFDWKLANGIQPKDLDMKEKLGDTVHRALPLLALASKPLFEQVY